MVVIDAVEKGKLELAGFVTAEYPLSKLEEAFAFVENNAADVRKVLIMED